MSNIYRHLYNMVGGDIQPAIGVQFVDTAIRTLCRANDLLYRYPNENNQIEYNGSISGSFGLEEPNNVVIYYDSVNDFIYVFYSSLNKFIQYDASHNELNQIDISGITSIHYNEKLFYSIDSTVYTCDATLSNREIYYVDISNSTINHIMGTHETTSLWIQYTYENMEKLCIVVEGNVTNVINLDSKIYCMDYDPEFIYLSTNTEVIYRYERCNLILEMFRFEYPTNKFVIYKHGNEDYIMSASFDNLIYNYEVKKRDYQVALDNATKAIVNITESTVVRYPSKRNMLQYFVMYYYNDIFEFGDVDEIGVVMRNFLKHIWVFYKSTNNLVCYDHAQHEDRTADTIVEIQRYIVPEMANIIAMRITNNDLQFVTGNSKIYSWISATNEITTFFDAGDNRQYKLLPIYRWNMCHSSCMW